MGFDSVYGLSSRGGNSSSEAVTVDRALAIPTVWRCVGLLATVIAGCPLNVYKDPGKKQVRVPVLDPNNSDLTYTAYELWELVVAHLALWGNAYVKKIRNNADAIIDLIPIVPALVKVQRHAKDGKHPDGKEFKVERIKNGALDGYDFYGAWDIMHVPGLGYNGLYGLAPLEIAAQTYGTALAADKLAAKFFSQGTALTGILQVKAPLSDQTQADEIKRRWRTVNAGAAHGGDIAVLDAETEFQQLTIPPDQLQFLESREWNATELARIYGIPPHLIGDDSKSASLGSGIEQTNMGFVGYTIGGWTARIEQRVTREIVGVRGQTAGFDLDELMKGSTSERFAAYALGIQWGWLTRNEARKKEDKEPIDGLDEPLLPLNMAPISMQAELLAKGGNTNDSTDAVTPPGSPSNHDITDAN